MNFQISEYVLIILKMSVPLKHLSSFDYYKVVTENSVREYLLIDLAKIVGPD